MAPKNTAGAISGEVVKKAEPSYQYVQKTIGSDTYLVMAQSQIELEDEFSSLYYTAQNQSNIFLEPPFSPFVLLELTQSNNTLNQCIEAMEVNVAGTGFDFEAYDDNTDIDSDEEQAARGIFEEPYPNESNTTILRKLWRQVEAVGYSYLEVLRNLQGDVVGWRNVETHNVRMVKLDQPIMVEKTVTRNGKDVKLNMWVRERRFAQRVALKTLVYYKEFGVSRNCDRNTGKWEVDGYPIPLTLRATELIIFGIHPDVKTPYFLPRWINEMPSVVGSRKAEEQNLQFLDSGGMPPAIIFVQGGTIGKEVSDQLRTYMSGQNKNKNRAIVVEAVPASGNLDSSGNVKVTVERFGAERAMDAMYMKYDEVTEEHVRVGFRLPPLFLGKPNDYNMATAVTAYQVAEEQVFSPERMVIEQTFNMTIMKDLGFKTIKLKLNPITLKDPANQIQLLTLVKDQATPDSFLTQVNKLSGFDLELAPTPQPDSVTGAAAGAPGSQTTVNPDGSTQFPVVTRGGRLLPPPPTPPTPVPAPVRGGVQKPAFATIPPAPPVPKAATGKKPTKPKTPKTALEIIDLAQDYASARGLIYKREGDPARLTALKEEIEFLNREDLSAFNSMVAQYAFGFSDPAMQLIAGQVN